MFVRRYIHKRDCFIPASGYRNNNNGQLNNVGNNGNYWSGSPNGTNGYNLNSVSYTHLTLPTICSV